jgi:hypothetical protein
MTTYPNYLPPANKSDVEIVMTSIGYIVDTRKYESGVIIISKERLYKGRLLTILNYNFGNYQDWHLIQLSDKSILVMAK